MDIEPGTSSEADKSDTALGGCWTKSLKFIPGFSYKKLEEHLVLDAKKPQMANLLRDLNTRSVDINYLKLVIQGSLW